MEETRENTAEQEGQPTPVKDKAVPFEPVRQAGSRAMGTAKTIGGRIRNFFHKLFVSVALLAIGFASCFFAMKLGYLPTNEPPVLSEEHTTVTVRELGKIVEPAADLITSRYRFTDANTADTSKRLLGFDVPLTRDMAVFTYDGVVGVGFNMDDVKFEVTEGAGDEKGEVRVTLPELTVIQNEIDMDSFEFAYQEHSIFNPQGMDHATDILSKLQNKAKKRDLDDDQFMAEARINAETTIKNFLEAAHVGDYYKITFTTPEAVETENEGK